MGGRGGARALILNTPHNQTGTVFSAADLPWVADLAMRHDLLVITDEIYEHIVFDGRRHESLAALSGMRASTIVVNSISKTGNATGWRVGWVIAPVAHTPSIRGFHDTLVIQAPTPLQRAAVALLGRDPGAFDGLRAAYARKRDTLVTALRRVGFGVSPPQGAYYLFARYRGVPAIGDRSPMAAAIHLIEAVGVASVPGNNFYTPDAAGDQYLRFAFCRSLQTLEEAVRRLLTLAQRARLHPRGASPGPHPGPLPEGEGETGARSSATRQLARCLEREPALRYPGDERCAFSFGSVPGGWTRYQRQVLF